MKNICNLTQQYGIYTIEFSTPNTAHRKYVIQTDVIELNRRLLNRRLLSFQKYS